MLYFDTRTFEKPGRDRIQGRSIDVFEDREESGGQLTSGSLYTYCGPQWSSFWSHYNLAHDYIALVILSVGVLTNILNLWVFTRKKNRQTPFNTVLLVLAISDLLFMVNGLVRGSIMFYRGQKRKINVGCGGGDDTSVPYQQIVEQLIYEFSYYLFHLYSIYLTVLLAILRFLGILYPLHSRSWFTERKVRWSIFATVLFSTSLAPLMFSQVKIIPRSSQGSGPVLYDRDTSDIGRKFMFWVYGVFGKLIPCLVLTFAILGIIFFLMKANQDRRRMAQVFTITKKASRGDEKETKENLAKNKTTSENQGADDCNLDRNQDTLSGRTSNSSSLYEFEFDRTTRMLLGILVLFFVTESPDGFVSLVYVLSTSAAMRKGCLAPLVNFLLLLDYCSSVSSFFIYFTMSHTFRSTLLQSFRFFSRPKFQRFK